MRRIAAAEQEEQRAEERKQAQPLEQRRARRDPSQPTSGLLAAGMLCGQLPTPACQPEPGEKPMSRIYPHSVPGRAVREERYTLVDAADRVVASAPSLADAERVRAMHQERHGPLTLLPLTGKA